LFAALPRVKEITGISAHSGHSELLNWLSKFTNKPAQIMLVHGEPSAQEALSIKIPNIFNIPVKIVTQNEEIALFHLKSIFV
jgi:metallo-beta-lactamase family protein